MKWVGRGARVVVAVGLLVCVISIALATFGQIITVAPLLLGVLGVLVVAVFVVTLLALMLIGALSGRNIVRSAASVFAWREVAIAAGLAAGFWVAAVVGFSGSSGGQPMSTPGCPTALGDHGTITCVSQEVFRQALVGQQLMIAGGFGFLLVLEFLGSIIVNRLPAPRTDSELSPQRAHSH